jgi:2-polyprenyl-3-methyl-5-hydroxy-6-metoxy-1,4-benzoquinol methylase
MNLNIKSPVNNQASCKIIKKIKTSQIIDSYFQTFQLDVSQNFVGLNEIFLCECEKTGYQFFYPLNLGGDGDFYKGLEKIEWYYQNWKWEFEIAKLEIGSNKEVLEIGCGNGTFLENISGDNNCVGLEINENSTRVEPYPIINTTLEEFAAIENKKFDWIISFQLLEHLSQIDSYFKSALKLLKQDGKILIVVPNNDAYFFKQVDFQFNHINYLETLLLNMPPHHLGLWNKKAIIKLAEEYNLERPKIILEPISEGRKKLNIELLKRSIHYKILFKIFNNELVYSILSLFNKSLQLGDSIFIILKK